MSQNDAPLLLDASRLIWRRWSGTRATGIDRICEAWMAHYGPRAQAVIVHRHGRAILPFAVSQALFRLLLRPEGSRAQWRAALAGLALRHPLALRDRLEGRGRFWLNPGHTGLDAPGLAAWGQGRGMRPVVLVHDLIPITHPQFCRPGEAERHRRRMLAVLDSASGVVANSAHTLATLAEFAASEGRAMPPAVVAWPGTPALPPITPRAHPEPTFVILGTIEGRKNHALLLEVWRRLIEAAGPAQAPRLIIVGRRGWQADAVLPMLDSGEFGDRVVEAGPLDDRRLALVLGGARALLFPSHAEGYGIPLAEALAAGVPVIASDLPVFREIGQGVPDLVPTDDLAAWQAAIGAYARDPSPRRDAQMARVASYRAPQWTEHFDALNRFLSKITG